MTSSLNVHIHLLFDLILEDGGMMKGNDGDC